MHDRYKTVNLQKHFQEVYKKVDPWHLGSSQFEFRKYKRQIDFIQSRIQPKTILELGCSEGAHTFLLKESFPESHIEAFDISPIAISRAQERLKKYENVNISIGDIANYLKNPIEFEYDLIVWSESIFYVAEVLSINAMHVMIDGVLSRLKEHGVFCMANTIQCAGDKILFPSKRNLFSSIFFILSHYFQNIAKASYIDFKIEDDCAYEYEVWVFTKGY